MPIGYIDVIFINKTATSGKLSQSRGSERARIYSHVQRGCRDPALAKAARESEASYKLPDSWSSEPGSDGARSNSTKGPKKRKSRPKSLEAKPQKRTDVATDALQASSKTQPIMSLDILSGGAGDPFDSLEVPMSPYTVDLIKFYSSDVVPRVFTFKKVANIARTYTVTKAFEDPLQRDALLCTTSAAIYISSGFADHGIAAMAFKGRALAGLQQQLSTRQSSKASSLSSMYSVALLLYVECLLGNVKDMMPHVAGLRQLVQHADFELFDDPLYIFATLFACYYLSAAILDTAPDLEPIGLGNCSGLSEAAQAALEDLSSGASLAAQTLFTKHADFLGPALSAAAIKQRSVVHFRYICGSGACDPSPADVQYVYFQEMAVEYELTALREERILTPAQHAVRLALFVFLPQPFVLVATPNAAFCRAMTKQMKTWLEKSNLDGLWAPRCDLLLWVLFVVSHISMGEAEWPWALSHLSTLIGFLNLQSMREMEQILYGFYYYPLYFGVTVDKIGEECRPSWSSGETPKDMVDGTKAPAGDGLSNTICTLRIQSVAKGPK